MHVTATDSQWLISVAGGLEVGGQRSAIADIISARGDEGPAYQGKREIGFIEDLDGQV
jgi:hypothetical protein